MLHSVLNIFNSLLICCPVFLFRPAAAIFQFFPHFFSHGWTKWPGCVIFILNKYPYDPL